MICFLLCPVGSSDCVSLKDRSSVLRNSLVDHPAGYSRWDFDARSISVLTMEGKSCLVFEFLDIYKKVN